MNYIFFILYTALGCWLIARIKFVQRSGLKPATIRGLFIVKILAGAALGWMSIHFYGNKPSDNDYWMINEESWKEYQLLLHHPKEYFSNIFHSPYSNGYSGFFNSLQSYWNDLKNNIIIKIVSVFNIFSQGNYYINSIFMNFIAFFGHVAFFRIFSNIYKERKLSIIVGCFLLPSCLYFSSGLHKDAVVFSAIGLFCFALYSGIIQKFTIKKIIVLVLCSIVLLLIRSYVIVLVIPATAAYILSVKKNWPAFPVFTTIYLFSAVLFFTIHKWIPAINPPAILVQKQQDFAAGLLLSTITVAKTAVPVNELQPVFSSVAENILPAMNHTLLRPYLTEHPSKALIPLSIEFFIYQLLFISAIIIVFKKRLFKIDPFILFGIFFTLTIYLNIGYIVSNLGSIVRYRSLYLPFLLCPILACFKFKKFELHL